RSEKAALSGEFLYLSETRSTTASGGIASVRSPRTDERGEAYAVAKIAGIKLCQASAREYGENLISAMPTSLYGPGDNFDLEKSDVLPGMIRKAHEAKLRNEKEFRIWRTGTPRREFLHADDLGDALRFLLENYDSPEIINVGCGEDVTIH